MADIDTSGGGGHKKGPGVKKSKKKSARVDLTAMVDLGFLLITFFIFTTTMAQPSAMDLLMPKDTPDETKQQKIKASGALTLIPGADDVIYYYEGDDPKVMQQTGYKEVRDIIVNKKRTTNPDDFMVVIKPTEESTYKNTVDLLDEMTINVVERYALVDVRPDELEIMNGSAPAAQ